MRHITTNGIVYTVNEYKAMKIKEAEFFESVHFTLLEILEERQDLEEYFARKDSDEANK